MAVKFLIFVSVLVFQLISQTFIGVTGTEVETDIDAADEVCFGGAAHFDFHLFAGKQPFHHHDIVVGAVHILRKPFSFEFVDESSHRAIQINAHEFHVLALRGAHHEIAQKCKK